MSRHLFLVFLTLISINRNNAIDIECECKTDSIFGYGCKVTKIEGNSCDINEVNLIHELNGKSENDVKFLNLTSDTLEFIPKGIREKFQNIEKLFIICEKINRITKNDLKQFGEKLNYLSIAKSSIVEIPSDLFAETPKISYLFIKSEKLENIHQNAFEPIMNSLQTLGVNFPCSDEEFAMNNEDAKILIENLKISCYNPRFISNEIERNCSEVFDFKSTTLRNLIEMPTTTIEPQILREETTKVTTESLTAIRENSPTQKSIIKINETATKNAFGVSSTQVKVMSPTDSIKTTAGLKLTTQNSIDDDDFLSETTSKNENPTDEPQTLIIVEQTTSKSSNYQTATTENSINLLTTTTLKVLNDKSENSLTTLQSTNFTSKNTEENQSTLKSDTEITSNVPTTLSSIFLTTLTSNLSTRFSPKPTTSVFINYDENEETTKKFQLENSTKKFEVENSTNSMNTTKSHETSSKNIVKSLFDESPDLMVWVVGILLLIVLAGVCIVIAFSC